MATGCAGDTLSRLKLCFDGESRTCKTQMLGAMSGVHEYLAPCFVGLRTPGELVAPGAYASPVHREQSAVDRFPADDTRHLASERNELPWPEVGVGFRVHRKLEHELSIVGSARYRGPVPVALELPVKLGIEVGEANIVS